MMKGNELLDILHLLVHRQLQALENLRDHPSAKHLMTVESPAHRRVIALGRRLADIVKKRRPAQPHIRRSPHNLFRAVTVRIRHIIVQGASGDCSNFVLRNMVNHLEGMGEIVLVPAPFHCLNSL